MASNELLRAHGGRARSLRQRTGQIARSRMLPGLYRWAFVVFGLNRAFYFFTRTRGKTHPRELGFDVTGRPSSCFTPALLIFGSRRLAHLCTISNRMNQQVLSEVAMDDPFYAVLAR